MSITRVLGTLGASLLFWLALSAEGPAARLAPRAQAAGGVVTPTSRALPELALRRAAITLRGGTTERHSSGATGTPTAYVAARLVALLAPVPASLVLRAHRSAHVCAALRRPYDAHAPPRTRPLA